MTKRGGDGEGVGVARIARASGTEDRSRGGLVDVITEPLEDSMTVTVQDRTLEGERLSPDHWSSPWAWCTSGDPSWSLISP